MIDSQKLAKLFSNFENQCAESIQTFEYRGINVWPHIKISLYFSLIRDKESTKNENERDVPKISMGRRVFRKLFSVIKFAWLLICLYFKRGRIFYLAYSVDKIKIGENGVYFNQIIDGFVKSNSQRKYLYAQVSHRGDSRNPSYFIPDINLDKHRTVVPVIIGMLKSNPSLLALSMKIKNSVLEYFRNEEAIDKFGTQSFDNMVVGFFADYYFYSTLLKYSKPRMIVTCENTGSAFLAASGKLKIKSVDLQHGVIDKNHPQYIFGDKLKSIKHFMPLPTYVGVFGELHKKLLLENNFWDDNQIEVLGSFRIEEARKKFKEKKDGKLKNGPTILIPTQWNIFGSISELIEILNKNTNADFKIKLKIHPLEYMEHVELYNDIAVKSKGKVQIADSTQNIYTLIEEAFIVVGFDSAVLLEAVALGTPVITIGTESLPKGILEYYSDPEITNSVKLFHITKEDEFLFFINETFDNPAFYSSWVTKCKEAGHYLFAEDYYSNCRKLIDRNLN